MGYEDNQLLATAALLAPVVEQWPELASLLPPAVKEQLAATAVRQALALAAGTA